MTPRLDDESNDADNGVLDGGVSLSSADLGLGGTPTSHVSIVIGADEDDDLGDDVVMGEVVTGETPVQADAPRAWDAVVEAALAGEPVAASAPVEAEPARAERVAAEPVGAEATSDAAEPADAPAPAADLPVVSDEALAVVAEVDQADVEVPVDEPAPAAAAAPAPAPAAVVPAPARAVERTTVPESTLVSRRIGDVAESSVRETPDLLTADRLVERGRIARPEPEGAWAHFLYSLTGGRVNIGDGKRARARKELDGRISAPLAGGAQFVAVISRKGGVGKTTVTTLLGMALAAAREDRVVAVDANPDRGTLADRIQRTSGKTVRDLVRERESLRGYNDVSSIVARDETRLDVLASDADPHVSVAFSAEEYEAVAEVAGHYYSIVLTDTGTGIVHSVAGATLAAADQLVVVASPSIDGSRLASETLTWLETNGYGDQVRGAIVVINATSPGAPIVRLDELEAHFRSRVRDVVRVPYDSLLATGGAIVFRDLQPATREAARTLAAKVVEGLRALAQAA